MADAGPPPDTTTDGNAQSNTNEDTTGQPQPTSVIAYMMSNKVSAALWLTRVFTVICTILFIIPIIGGDPMSFYQRTLISSAATSALRLHQRLPNFQFNREFFGMLFLEDSCHYLIFSLIFMTTYPITMALVPIFLFALLHAMTFTKTLLNLMGPGSLQFAHTAVAKVESQQTNILRFIACAEIFIMPVIIFMMFSGKSSLFLPFIYYRFISLRYASRRNPYCRTVFSELRLTIETFCSRPQCPGMIRNITDKGIALISRLAPQTAPAAS